VIKETAAKILQDAQLGVPGQSLFIFHVPDAVKSCIVIIDSLDGVERDESLPGYKKASFKVIVRQADYTSAVSIANKVVAALDLHRQSVNGIYINRMRATHDPIAFPVPDSDVIEVAVNMAAIYVEP